MNCLTRLNVAIAIACLAGTSLQWAFADEMSGGDGGQQVAQHAQDSAVYKVWDPSALKAFDAVRTCLSQSPSDCSPSSCDSVEKSIAWLGALCRANVAGKQGDEASRAHQLDRGLASLMRALNPQSIQSRTYLAHLELPPGTMRTNAVAVALGSELRRYVQWLKVERQTAQDREPLAALEKRAAKGDANAEFYLGQRYEEGRNVGKDLQLALLWYRKAAEQGNASAQLNLGAMIEDGRGVARDNAEATAWYRKAAEQGDADGEYNLGLMLENGRGVQKDETEAAAWYHKAAELGGADAEDKYGEMLANGRGVSKDELEAVNWYRKAANQGHSHAQFDLGLMYGQGRGVDKDEVQAVEWFRKSAEQGQAEAQGSLGLMYEHGQGRLLQDYATAASWYVKSAQQGNAFAQRNLANLYQRGLGVPRSLVTAYAWMDLAASRGQQSALADRDQLARKLDSEGLTKAQDLARAWKPGQSIPEIVGHSDVH